MQLNEMGGTLIDRLYVPGQATAGTVDDWALKVCDAKLTLVALKIVPNAAITANGTNYFDLAVINKGAAAAGTTSMATRSWIATNSVAFVAESLTLSLTTANLNAAAGDVLDLQRTVTGTGLIMPDMLVELHYKLR